MGADHSSARLDGLRTGDGRPLPPRLKAEIGRELERLELLGRHLVARMPRIRKEIKHLAQNVASDFSCDFRYLAYPCNKVGFCANH